MVGHNFHTSDDICGIVCLLRKTNRFELWTRTADNEVGITLELLARAHAGPSSAAHTSTVCLSRLEATVRRVTLHL